MGIPSVGLKRWNFNQHKLLADSFANYGQYWPIMASRTAKVVTARVLPLYFMVNCWLHRNLLGAGNIGEVS